MINLLANVPINSLPIKIKVSSETSEIDNDYLLHDQQLYRLVNEEKYRYCGECDGCEYRLINRHTLVECVICTYNLQAIEVKNQREKLSVFLNHNYYELYQFGDKND